MSRNDPTIDDILRELELDVPRTDGDPAVDALVQDLIDERQQPGIDPHSGEELPTRVFLQTPKKKRHAPAPAAPRPAASAQDAELELLLQSLTGSDPAPAAAQPEQDKPAGPAKPVQKAVSEPKPEHKPEPVKTPAEPEPQKPAEPVLPPRPRTEKPVESYVTGPIPIDVDTIRSGAPKPKVVPAQSAEEIEGDKEETVCETAPAEEKQGRTRSAEKLRYAPCFRQAVLSEDASQPSGLESIFRKIYSSARTRGWILLLIFALSLALIFLMEQSRTADPDWIPSRLMMGIMAALGLGAGVTAWPAVGGGLWSLIRLEPNRDTLPALGWLINMGQTAALVINPEAFMQTNIHCFLPAAILLLAVSCLGQLLTAGAGLRNLRFLYSDEDKYIPHLVEDKRLAAELTRGLTIDGSRPVSNRRAVAVTDLAAVSLAPDSSDRLSRFLTLLGLIAGLFCAMVGFFITESRHLAGTLLSAVYLFFSPALTAVLTAGPVSRTARQMEPLRGIVAGEMSSDQFRTAGAVLTEARQLIPPEFITLAAIKTFEGTRLDDILVDAASVLYGTDSILTELFSRVIGQRKGLLREASNVEIEDGTGIAGWVGGRRLLIGNRAMMASYDVRIPSKEYERRYAAQGHDLVYLAASGELAAIFVLTLHPSLQASEAAQTLTDNGIGLVVSSSDSLVTAERLSALFRINPAMVKILPRRLNTYAKRLSGEVRVKQALVVNDGSINGLAGSLTFARRLRTMITLNAVLAITSVVLGCILTLIFSLLGALQYLSPTIFCGYILFWLILGWLLQKLFR